MPLRNFLGKLANEVQNTIDQAGNWSGSAPGGYGYPGAAAVPQATTPCPRQQPQAGHTDWIGLNDPRFATFNVCPQCYNSLIRPTPYAGAFVTKAGAIAPPPHVAVRCDMSRFWVRTAGMVLLTMNADRRHDVTLLARVAGLRAQDGDCPNAGLTAEHQPLPLARRNWYTIQDPNTGMQPLPGWTLCATCVLALQTCCPALAPAFAPVQPLGERDSSCGLVPSDRYDDTRTGMVLQQVGACAVITAVTRRPDMSQLLNWLRANPPPVRTGVAPAPGGVAGPGVVPVSGVAGGNCPRNMLSTTHKCYTMQGLFDFTVCEDCYGAVVKLDLDKGVELARRFDGTPSAMASGFTCQLYSDRMRRVWADAVSTGDFEYLRQKVLERRAKEREVQTKTAQLQQQAAQLRQQAEVKEHLAANAMRVAANAASNNILLAGVGVTYQVDAYHYVRPSGVADFSQTTQLNNEAAMLKVQAAQAESEMAMAGDEWRRYWE